MKAFATLMTAAAVSADSQFLYNMNSGIVPATTYLQPGVAMAQPLQYVSQVKPVEYKFVQPEMKQFEMKPVEYKKEMVPKPIEYKTVVEKKNIGTEYKTVVEQKPVVAYTQTQTLPLTYSAGMPLTYNTYGAQPITYTQPMVYTTAQQKVVAKPIIAYDAKVKSYSNDAENPATNYAAKGLYRAETDGSLHIAKRDADADAQVYANLGYNYQVPTVYKTPTVYRTPVVSSGYKYVSPVSYTTGAAYQPYASAYNYNYGSINPYFF